MSALSEAKFNEMLLANEKTSQRMIKVGIYGSIASLLASVFLVGIPFIVVFGTTALIGVIRKARPPKAGKFYLAPGVLIGLVELVLAGVLFSIGNGINDVHSQAVATLGSILLGFVVGVVGGAVLLAGLIRTATVNAVTAKAKA